MVADKEHPPFKNIWIRPCILTNSYLRYDDLYDNFELFCNFHLLSA